MSMSIFSTMLHYTHHDYLRPSVKYIKLKSLQMCIAFSSFNSNTSLSFYHNYLKLQLLINWENNYNSNTTKSILGEFLK